MAYNKREESIPVDGLLPWVKLFEITAQVCSSGRLFPFAVENIADQRNDCHDEDAVLNQVWPSYIFHHNHSLSGSVDSTAYRLWYALRALVYHICWCLSNLRNAKKALDISMKMAYNKREEGIPVDGLLPLFELKRFNRRSLVARGGYFFFLSWWLSLLFLWL